MLWSYKNGKKNWVERGLGQVRIKNLFALTIPDKENCNNMEESCKTGQEKKSLVSAFAYFLGAIHKV